MKNKLLAVLATFGMVASASAVKINNNLSINGFLDGSYQLTDTDGGANDNQQIESDEVELNFVLTHGSVSGLIAIDSADTQGNTGLSIEQAHFTYDLGNGVSVTLGRYGSALGFEREDPAGLYTFSRAYGGTTASEFNYGNTDDSANEGVSVAYSADSFSIAASFQNKRDANIDLGDDLDLEVSFAYTGIADTTIGGGYLFDNQADAATEIDVLNIHASRSFGKFLFAAEYSEMQDSSRGDRDAYLVLVDYDYNDKIGAALRFSSAEQFNAIGAIGDYESLTIAPNYSITENLGAIFEYSDVEDNGAKSDNFAVELTYTF
jgi:hypothetical protein